MTAAEYEDSAPKQTKHTGQALQEEQLERALPAQRTHRPRELGGRRRALLQGGALLALSLAAYAVLCAFVPPQMADMLVYRAEGEAVVTGQDLYALRVTEWDLPATYPPFAAILFVPTTWLGVPALKLLTTACNIALLGLLAHLSLRFADWPRPELRPAAVLAATAVGIWLEPVFQTLHFGQINLLITVLVLWDLSRPDAARTKGMAVGVAAGVKLTPGIFTVYLLLTGRVRAAAVSAAAFLGTAAVGWGVLPGASLDFWTRRMFQTGRVGNAWIVDNQSLQGLLARLLHTPEPGAVWPLVAVLTAAAGLGVAAYTARSGSEAWGVLCCAATALLVSPISWSHHWVWCVPLLVLLATEACGVASRRAVVAAVAVAFTARSMWLVPKDGDLDLRLAWWQQPFASPYPLLGLAFLACAALRVRRLGTPPGPV